jgi:hypothetical protein
MPSFDQIKPGQESADGITLALVEAVGDDRSNDSGDRRAAQAFVEFLRHHEVDAHRRLVHEDDVVEYFKQKTVERYGFGDELALIKAVQWGDYADECLDGLPDLFYMSPGDDHLLDGNWWLL